MSKPDVTINIKITESAQAYLKELLVNQESPGIGVRIFVEKAGTPSAECCMAYCPSGEEKPEDEKLSFDGFPAFIPQQSLPYLEDAVVDYDKDRFGGQLTFKAPKSKIPQLGESASIEEHIHHILEAEINPMLSSHGGFVTLERMEEEGTVAVLRFGGGCQGCASVDLTLKDGVESTLLERLPNLKKVVDVTDHSDKENAYY